MTVLGTSRLTLVGEIAGRRLSSAGRLTETTEPHPSLAGWTPFASPASTAPRSEWLASSVSNGTSPATLLFSANLVKPFTSAGLNARWISTFSLDYSFEP